MQKKLALLEEENLILKKAMAMILIINLTMNWWHKYKMSYPIRKLNQIALYSWIILKCCHFVATGQCRSAKVQHFQGFSAFRVLLPLFFRSLT